MRVGELERIMDDYDYQGFPVVQSLSDPVIQGFITRGDLEYALCMDFFNLSILYVCSCVCASEDS
jgi:hypothetical protein